MIWARWDHFVLCLRFSLIFILQTTTRYAIREENVVVQLIGYGASVECAPAESNMSGLRVMIRNVVEFWIHHLYLDSVTSRQGAAMTLSPAHATLSTYN